MEPCEHLANEMGKRVAKEGGESMGMWAFPSKGISKRFAGVPLLIGLGAVLRAQGTEIEHSVSQGVTETRKPL